MGMCDSCLFTHVYVVVVGEDEEGSEGRLRLAEELSGFSFFPWKNGILAL